MGHLARAALSILSAAAAGCGLYDDPWPTPYLSPTPSSSPTAQPLVSILAAEAEYTLAWADEGATASAGGWSFTTDLGYEVSLTSAYVVSYWAQLVPCDNAGAFRALAGGPAGHGENDHSVVVAPVVEALGSPAEYTLGESAFDANDYCGIHYLIGSTADPPPAELPDDVDMTGLSLYLAGSWSPPGGGDPVPFQVSTDVANGVILLFDDPSIIEGAPGEGEAARLTVRVERALAPVFDGIDLAAVDDDTLVFRALVNLLAGVRVSGVVSPTQGDGATPRP